MIIAEAVINLINRSVYRLSRIITHLHIIMRTSNNYDIDPHMQNIPREAVIHNYQPITNYTIYR